MGFGGKYPPILGHGRAALPGGAPAFCAQLVELSVKRTTGEVQVQRMVMVQDVGCAINPVGIEGQMHGGAVQGLGWALHEQLCYDESGQVLSGSWMDYAVPHAQHAPMIETVIVEVPSEHGVFGIRGVGEPPVIATAAAVANAIADATGKRLTQLPMTAPRVLTRIQTGDG
jgi:CO/xanthine dehydrogenase Mo-binding subunit